MRPRLLLTINCKFTVDFVDRGLHTRIAVARLPLRQLGFLVFFLMLSWGFSPKATTAVRTTDNTTVSLQKEVTNVTEIKFVVIF